MIILLPAESSMAMQCQIVKQFNETCLYSFMRRLKASQLWFSNTMR